MKTRKNRVLLPTSALLLLSGCASVQNHPLYAAWQERAYSAYGMPVPAAGDSSFLSSPVPYNFNHGNGLHPMPQVIRIANNTPRTSAAEQQYISSYYSLQ